MSEMESPFGHIQEPRKKAFLKALARTGRITVAATSAGIDPSLPYTRGWKEDAEFQAALPVAMDLFSAFLEDEAVRRAIDGDRSYKFTKDGTALRHPETCVCGHEAREHLRDPQSQTRHAGRCVSTGPVDADGSTGPCDCEAFLGAPYYEDKRSDTMLIFTMKGMMPAKYGDRMEVRGALAGLDVSKWSDGQISRLIAGEHPMQILSQPEPLAIGPGVTVHEGVPPESDDVQTLAPDDDEPAPRGDDAGPEDGEEP